MADHHQRLGCVVVHHASRDTIRGTVENLLRCGVPADGLIVVDNSPSEQPDIRIVDGVQIVRVENRGYAAAVNLGVRVLEDARHCEYTLVCTHETMLAPDALDKLIQAMDESPTAAVAGPTLFSADSGEVWSAGGLLTHRMHLPRHHRSLDSGGARQVDREWLDGAANLYRTAHLIDFTLDETYFLYFEETDLHTRFRRAGLRVVWVPDAVGYQRSKGIPPRLLGRNEMLFQARNFSIWEGRLAVAFEALRSVARKLASGRGEWGSPFQILEGWLDAERLLAQAAREG